MIFGKNLDSTDYWNAIYRQGCVEPLLIENALEHTKRGFLAARISKNLSEALQLTRQIEEQLRRSADADRKLVDHECLNRLSQLYTPVYDDLLIMAAFETAYKARLLTKKLIIHRISSPSELKVCQRKRPIRFTEYTGKVKLRPITIGYSELFSDLYLEAAEIDKRYLNPLKEMQNKRNNSHFNTNYWLSLNSTKIESVIYVSSLLDY